MDLNWIQLESVEANLVFHRFLFKNLLRAKNLFAMIKNLFRFSAAISRFRCRDRNRNWDRCSILVWWVATKTPVCPTQSFLLLSPILFFCSIIVGFLSWSWCCLSLPIKQCWYYSDCVHSLVSFISLILSRSPTLPHPHNLSLSL